MDKPGERPTLLMTVNLATADTSKNLLKKEKEKNMTESKSKKASKIELKIQKAQSITTGIFYYFLYSLVNLNFSQWKRFE